MRCDTANLQSVRNLSAWAQERHFYEQLAQLSLGTVTIWDLAEIVYSFTFFILATVRFA